MFSYSNLHLFSKRILSILITSLLQKSYSQDLMRSLGSYIPMIANVLGGILVLFVAIYVMPPGPDPVHFQSHSLSVVVDYSHARLIPDTLFGIFFEEINHAGAGGIWGELVRNRGFEEMGYEYPPRKENWGVIGDRSNIITSLELTSCFKHNKVALRMDVLSDLAFDFGVGIWNFGYWGMNIVEGNTYKVTFYSRSTSRMNVTVSFTSIYSYKILASSPILVADVEWKKFEVILKPTSSDPKARLQLTTTTRGSIWFDQVSAMATDTYKGHGFRKDLMEMLLNLKPRFLRFPGGNFVEGRILKNVFRWKETVGPWEDRPGHYYDLWAYWSDDGLGFLEYLQLAEDLAAIPVWVVNAGISFDDQVNSSFVGPFVQDMLDGIEFARGDINSTWGSLRAKYGHPKPFDLRYIVIGNEDCVTEHPLYIGNYLKFHSALKAKYKDINVINNCDPTIQKLDVPADMFDYHIYDQSEIVFSKAHIFDDFPRSGPKVSVSEYGVADAIHKNGTLIAALAEAGFLIGLERNSDVVSMANYAQLFMNMGCQSESKEIWTPDAIYFDTSRAFGSPSYWMQSFFVESSGSYLLDLNQSGANNCIASAIRFKSNEDGKVYVKVKVVNFQENHINMTVTFKGVDRATFIKGSKQNVLTSNDPYDTNTFEYPTKVKPKSKPFKIKKNEFTSTLHPYSLTSFDLCFT